MEEATTPAILLRKQHQWPMIARDIILLTNEGDKCHFNIIDIARSYDIPLDQFTELLKLDKFKIVVQAEVERYKNLGERAGYKMRAEALIMDIQERLYSKICNDSLDDKLTVQFLQTLMKSVGLDGQEYAIKKDMANSSQINIAFNIPRLSNPKLSHLMGNGNNNIIDVT